jgi:hypothetical protein
MANENQNEYGLPTPSANARITETLLPTFYRTDSNKKFIHSTLTQLTQPGTVKKVSGYIGRQNAKSVSGTDVFLKAANIDRQNYQLEPAAVIKDYIGNINFYKDYVDHINHIDIFGGITNNHERLNQQELYSWDPHIDWDKFVNFQHYYWLPYGPNSITVAGQQLAVDSTYTVKLTEQGGSYAYMFTPDGLTINPTLTLYRGQTYRFIIDSPSNIFSIKTIRTQDTLNRYTNEGVTNNSITEGELVFTVPHTAPSVLYYLSENDVNIGGVFTVKDIDQDTFLNVEADIVGKKTYKLSNGTSLSNGMKLEFTGNISPEIYSTGYWYVEGVGSAIKLISENDLEILASYSIETVTLFDDTPFDQEPFSALSSAAKTKDYLTVNRASPDRNPWSRYNRWFHEDVITASGAELDQFNRAIRPIIEFSAGLKLHNFGHQAKKDVDLVDTYTTDIFSNVEGSLGYIVDGVSLAEGMRVLFTADTDSRVKNKIYKINFVTVIHQSKVSNFDASKIDVTNNIINFATGINTVTGINYNDTHGFNTGDQLTYLSNTNLDIAGLLNRKTYYVSVIDNSKIKLYYDKGLTNLVDILGVGSGTHQFANFAGSLKQINLTEETDAEAQIYETVLIRQGSKNQGLMYWFNGTTWELGQVKTKANQCPMFDIFDESGISYSDTSLYTGTNFEGTRVFSYKSGTSSLIDTELGFALSYQNINNIGDISFNFDLLNDSFNYKINTMVETKKTDIGFLKLINDRTSFKYTNGWNTSLVKNIQPVVRIFKDSGLVNNFPIDVYNNITSISDLVVRVYINGKRLDPSLFKIVTLPAKKIIQLVTDVALTDVVTLKTFSATFKNNNGYYEIPVNLQNNPLNNNLIDFTLGEVINHVDSIVENISNFSGAYPGVGNLRDLGNITPYGTRFVQHGGPLNLSLYHLGSQTANIFKAIEKANTDYSKFKRAFLIEADNSGIDTNPRQHVDFILNKMLAGYPKTYPYYLSDMFGYNGAVRLEYTVLDSRITKYPLTDAFTLTNLSNQSVILYLNGVQLVHGKDYVFGADVFFEILTPLTVNDTIEAYEYHSTDGSFCPSTPTKLGLYPKFEPKIFIDNTYRTPQKVIQGHDGSITIAFDDFRDELILELEKRIFNNIKVAYDAEIFNIYDFIPGYERPTAYSKAEFDQVLSTFFYQWTSLVSQDYTKQTGYEATDPFTFNYSGNYSPNGKAIPAYWRGIFNWYLDTDRPHTHPWEVLGFSIEPMWWTSVYGSAPYTSNNLLLWEDLRNGIIREPNTVVKQDLKFVRSILDTGLPVDESGNLANPLTANFVNGLVSSIANGAYAFGDYGPVETAWRNSSYFPFALMQTLLLLQPSKVLGTCFDRSRIVKNLANQFVYADTNLRFKLSDIVLPSTTLSSTRTFASGLVNYLVDYMLGETTVALDQYTSDVQNLTNNLGSKLGGFTSKPKFNLLLDSKNPSATAGIFVPQENYNIFLNTSSPVQKLVYSGVMITKVEGGNFEISGYVRQQPYFKYYNWITNGHISNVGGISESYVTWNENQYYLVGTVVRYGSLYYRVVTTHTSAATFNGTNFIQLSGLPTIGGADVYIREAFDTTQEQVLSYGTQLNSIQSVVDFILGYGAYLTTQGFVFDEFNSNLSTVSNWESSAKEFVFWTTQGWAPGSVLSLSPSASQLTLATDYSTVNDITDNFYGYQILRVDGQALAPELTSIYRNDNNFVLSSKNTNHGIYGAVLYLIQKEHVLLLDNRTMFNDVIYNLEPGYRQERIKVLGYITQNWNGGFNIPGFIFDQAKIVDWAPHTDYNLGDIVKYKSFYYSAAKKLSSLITFDDAQWIKLTKQPTAELLPNWDYKVQQFTDFYNLDNGNFDVQQQEFAQHLIGYQSRQYLANIIQDDVSQYKFYQGMIIEKGTQNVLNKLFDVLSADNTESLTFNEEWALRVGEYGSVDTFTELEFILDINQFKINPQSFELVNTVDQTLLDFVYRQTPTDVYVKPADYNNNPWPLTTKKPYLRTPGYARYSDVKYSLNTLADAINLDITTFIDGDYVWCPFDSITWNVYRFTKNTFKITDVTYSNNLLTLMCNQIPNVIAGDIIGINHSTSLNGFYQITSVLNTNITVTAKIQGFVHSDFLTKDLGNILSYKFLKSRVDNVDKINEALPPYLKPNELIWADNDGSGKWAVYQHNPVYTESTIDSMFTTQKFAKLVASSPDGNTIAIADYEKINLYSKNFNNTWQNFSTTLFSITVGDIKFSPDGKLVAYSNATTNTVKVLSIGYIGFNVQNTVPLPTGILSGDLFGSKIVFSQNEVDGYLLIISSSTYNYSQGRVDIFASEDGTSWTHTEQLLAVTATYSQFGYSITATANGGRIVVSAPGSDQYSFATNTGEFVPEYTYNANDYVRYSGSYYQALVETNTTPPSSDWRLMASSIDVNTGEIFIYHKTDTGYGSPTEVMGGQQITTINPGDRFGESVSLSADGKYLAVGSPLANLDNFSEGKVQIFTATDTAYSYIPLQTLTSPKDEKNELFGSYVEFIGDAESLIVLSAKGSINNTTTFDSVATTFDNNSLVFIDKLVRSGRVDIFDRYNIKFIYAESFSALSATNLLPEGANYGISVSAGKNTVLAGAPNNGDGVAYTYTKQASSKSWSVLHYQVPAPDVSKIKKAFLYNKRSNQLITYLDVVDTPYGHIPGIADQEIKYKTYYDPAVYSYTDKTVTSININAEANWLSDKVGTLWWNLTRAKFIENLDGDIVYRSTNWNKLYAPDPMDHPEYSASIDVYEWVSSRLTPDQWDARADTEAGLAVGISGKSLYGRSVYSTSQRFDTVTKSLISTYYFWVKNKTITPNILGRTLSAAEVANLISDPISYGYSCLVLTGSNSFSLVNCKQYLKSADIVLHIDYWNIDNKEQNLHTEWKIVSEDPNTELPSAIESKWFESLSGQDVNGQQLPDLSLPLKQRYGILSRPRQSMFVNRFEALKQFITDVNITLSSVLVSDNYDLTDLNKAEPAPGPATGKWDMLITSEVELQFVGTTKISQAVITPIVATTGALAGQIVGATIVDSGRGYVNAPYIEVVGNGEDALIKTTLNSNGGIASVVIVNPGTNYDQSTTKFLVRSYSVLVTNDSNSYDKWAILQWNAGTKSWARVKSQSYDVTKFWQYIDWYAIGYSQFTKIDYIVDNTYYLATLNANIGSVVKVKNIGTGGWILLEKYNNISTIDYTQNYEVIGRQNGTIEFLSNLYDSSSATLGFSDQLYDSAFYDDVAGVELQIILATIKNKLLINELKPNYLKLFFGSLRYVFYEQSFVDWAFKTSFVKARHNVGTLNQPSTYQPNNLSNFENYIDEVKPYRTSIREYISSYTSTDYAREVVSDFDLLPVIDDNSNIVPISVSVEDGEIVYNSKNITQYPWKMWYDNAGFTITSIKIVNGGSGYISPPVVKFVGGYGSGAVARAYISSGSVNRIELISGGTGYLEAPVIQLDGGLNIGGIAARASAIIESKTIRTNKIAVKFDRITKSNFITNNIVTETFKGTGSKLQFALKWAPQIQFSNDQTVTVDNVDVLRNEYAFSIRSKTTGTTTEYYGVITFTTAPPAPIDGTTLNVSVKYVKDFVHYNAADRIQYNYEPTVGDIGKDFSQLMTGVDYGGVNIMGLDFTVHGGWDLDFGWDSDAWDSGTIDLDPDGSLEPNSDTYDTQLNGGMFRGSALTTAVGYSPDDIVVDGDKLISPMNSHAPEEVVPGQVIDSLSIKVYTRAHEDNPEFGFMQFKDMLNRVHYKRLNAAKATTLSTDLTQNTMFITVENGSVLTPPNPAANMPGIVFINGERIEFFVKIDNVLSQLRRGTLGTGAPEVHLAGSVVQDVGPTETIPYSDQIETQTIEVDGVASSFTSKLEFSRSDDIDVFVGGYRLKKTNSTVFVENNDYPYSPLGNTTYPPEFTVTGNTIHLVAVPTIHTKIVIVKNNMTYWEDGEGISLGDSNNTIANFIKKNATIEPR